MPGSPGLLAKILAVPVHEQAFAVPEQRPVGFGEQVV
jgi:hypothetical protein